MRTLLCAAAFALLLAAPASAQTSGGAAQMLKFVPSDVGTVTNYYKQDVYDPSDNKIGSINDVLVDNSGKVSALMVGVGGFLGVGEKDVAVPFSAVHGTHKNGKWWLVMNTSKDALKSAPGFKYDSGKTSWVPE